MPQIFIGTSPALQAALARAAKMARGTARVLLTGETGTGKEKMARHIHDLSARAAGPFIALNCASLSPELLESELFGHVKGAFTSALRMHRGLVAEAAGGTLFLDEIGELAPPLQAKLLRFIETGEFRKVGGTDTERSDARIISATHRDLLQRSRNGAFRADLYFRLAVLVLYLAPLRERPEDIIPLAHHFIAEIAAQENRPRPALDDAAAKALQAAPWPGNIRELYNVLHQALVLNDGDTLTTDMLGLEGAAQSSLQQLKAAARPQPLWRVEEAAIDAALAYCGGHIPKAAALLEINPSTLYRRLQSRAPLPQTPEFERGF